MRIENAEIGQLIVESSSVTIADSTIAGDDVSLHARDSAVVAAAVQLRGRVASLADGSVFDLAGVTLQAREPGVPLEGAPSRSFFSVSEWQDSEYQADPDFIWPRP